MDKNKYENKHIEIFNWIAPVYGLFYGYQKRLYGKVLDKLQGELDLTAYKNVVDVGCGTGAFCSILHQKGLVVTGVDPSQKMLNIAMKKQENREIKFINASATEMLPFENKSFDVSIASYVAHGLKAYERKKMYSEMNRITKHLVIIHDYNENGSFLASMVEWLEGGDYFNFIKKVKSELKDIFRDVRVIDVYSHAAWYICMPKD